MASNFLPYSTLLQCWEMSSVQERKEPIRTATNQTVALVVSWTVASVTHRTAGYFIFVLFGDIYQAPSAQWMFSKWLWIEWINQNFGFFEYSGTSELKS